MKAYKILQTIASALVILLSLACSKQENLVSASAPERRAANDEYSPSGVADPSDFFPTTIGTKWVYDIYVPDIENNPPLTHAVEEWENANRSALREKRGRLLMRDKPADGKVQLIISVKNNAAEQGQLKYPEGYELEVERDDLGIFSDSAKLYWAISHSGRYQVSEVSLHHPSMSPYPNGYSLSPGMSMRIAFFGSRPFVSIGLAHQNDSTLFVRMVRYGSKTAMHFQRQVEADDRQERSDEGSFLLKGFTEDVWYVKGVGLTRLIQMVNGQVTMIWQLESEKGKPMDEPYIPDTLPRRSKSSFQYQQNRI